MQYQVLLFYKYVTITNPKELQEKYETLAKKYHLKGRIIIAEEGINMTLEGLHEDTEAFVEAFLSDPRFADTHIKRSKGDGNAFPRLSVKVRNEIVGTRFPKEVDPRIKTGNHLQAEELHQWFRDDKDFTIVDMRNSYEYAAGHFKGSDDLGMQASRELVDAVEKLKDKKDATIVTVCTGGIKCEKMSSYLLHQGFKDVHQLSGGIHTYMEKYPGKDFLGTLYTYDNRLVMDFGGDREVVGKCAYCKGSTESFRNCDKSTCNRLLLVCDECYASKDAVYCNEECACSVNEVRVPRTVSTM